jgi:triosephosphate isomerase
MSEKKSKLVVGNWKMHGNLADNAPLLAAVAAAAGTLPAHVSVGVCVPAPYLAQAQAALTGSRVRWGIQDLSGASADRGAFTGEISAAMAVDFKATLALTGHSERRSYHQETDAQIVEKTQRALERGLTPVVCVGESLEERESGRTEVVVGTQLGAVLSALDVADLQQIVFAYEPVWAIGSGKSATAAQAQDVHAFLRKQLTGRDSRLAGATLLYGGSVKPANAAELFGQPDIDGGLIGGAALVADDFIAICKAAAL